MGCGAALGPEIFKHVPGLDFAVGTRCAGAIPRLVARVLAGETGLLEVSDLDETPDVIKARTDTGFSVFVTILLGCDRRCAYCIVPDVRGSEYSRPAREIVAEIRALVRNGVREVTLLGQSVMNYGRANSVWEASDAPSPGGFTEPFARLLEAVATIPGLLRLRFTSGHPSDVTDQLVRACATLPAICHHLPAGAVRFRFCSRAHAARLFASGLSRRRARLRRPCRFALTTGNRRHPGGRPTISRPRVP